MSQFAFLSADFPDLLSHAAKAEALALSDPRGACFWARLTLETALKWLYRSEPALSHPYGRELAVLIAEPSLTKLAGVAVVAKARYVKDQGNRAAHDGSRPPDAQDAATALRELFHICYWLAHTYAVKLRPDPAQVFDPAKLEKSLTISASTVAQILKLREEHDQAARKLEEAEKARRASEEGRKALEAELAALRAQIAEFRQLNTKAADVHDYNEAATRDAFIDLLLAEAGWALDQPRDREFPVRDMPNASGAGFVDYVLWGADGKPLAVVEAKRTKKDARVGQRQAKLYADALEKAYGRRPLIFYTNGHEHWFWDDALYPPRAVSGFLKRDEMELLIQRRASRKPLAETSVDPQIAGRYYQARAIHRVGEAFEKDRRRKALLVMATGSGKTRTVIALIDQLMRANWVRRALFLADRVALVRQAHNAFKTHLPSAPAANLLDGHDPAKNDQKSARVLFSTYPTMMGRIEEMDESRKRFGPGHFDLIVIDEAHRSIYRKYRAIFEYFDGLLVGLTATPRDEIDRDTYGLFELERGVPTDAYDLEDAVKDGYLVPPKGISVPLKFQREGVAYDQLSEEEKAEWDALDWDEEGVVPDRVEAGELNSWLFNKDTVDKVLLQLMTEGIKVDGGDKLGKTIVFAKNSRHAHFIVERFDANYPHLKGEFAQVVDYSIPYAQSLIDDFSDSEKTPQITVSVDMLDTGIDAPDVVNLVFFKAVRSKTKFWQMVGRGTRLRPGLFGPGEDKTEFLIFDYCQNLEFFRAEPQRIASSAAPSVKERLFRSRLDLLGALETAETEPSLAEEIRTRLFDETAGINPENFVARPHRRLIERYQDRGAWRRLDAEARSALARDLAGLPTSFRDESPPAKAFDLLILTAQLALLREDPALARLQLRIQGFAATLETLANVPLVAKELTLIQEIQNAPYWESVTPSLLEEARRRLRKLAELIEPQARKIVVTDFEDEIGAGATVDLPQLGSGIDKAKFKTKVRSFLDAHQDHITILKVRRGEQLTAQDLAELERILIENGAADAGTIAKIKAEGGVGRFFRSLVKLDRAAAKAAFSDFAAKRQLTATQLEFLDLTIDSLTENGVVDPGAFYASPFTDLDDQGVSGVFDKEAAQEVISIVRRLNEAVAA
ncbi:DEAD/DEAH box helicase family protein [Neomegalonema perideroedes]|uniref:DEAD/DEAH box helicase family protein n=1 Tax=Neomegalonema perideroedes TaxID=217219 RepID=UPI00036756DD|nr:DEAD/DEAH box helicase family protein [Neomegalonema perideroedes]